MDHWSISTFHIRMLVHKQIWMHSHYCFSFMIQWNELKPSQVGFCTSLLILITCWSIYRHVTNGVVNLYKRTPPQILQNPLMGTFGGKSALVLSQGKLTGCLFWINFGWTKKNWLERDMNLRPPHWRAVALPTELTSPVLAVSLVRSHETMYCPLARDHAQVTIQPNFIVTYLQYPWIKGKFKESKSHSEPEYSRFWTSVTIVTHTGKLVNISNFSQV